MWICPNIDEYDQGDERKYKITFFLYLIFKKINFEYSPSTYALNYVVVKQIIDRYYL